MITYLGIFIAKTIEVSLGTLKTVLLTKGERVVAALIGFVEICIWLVVMSTVITGISDDPIKGVMYALGYSSGCLLGSYLESILALGVTTLTVIVDKDKESGLSAFLRSEGFAVTEVCASGKDTEKIMMYIGAPRKSILTLKKLIIEKEPNAMIFSTEMKPISGGFGLKK